MVGLEIYESRRGLVLRKQWRWRVRASNGRIIAVSSEGYNNRYDMLKSVDVLREILDAPR